MNTNLSLTAPSQVETECLVAVVLDQSDKDKPAAIVDCGDAPVREAAKDVITSGEVTGKIKDNPLLRLGAPKEKAAPAPAETTAPAPKEKSSRSR